MLRRKVILNRGTGAGGVNTNVSGKGFEEKTTNIHRLIANGFVRKSIPACTGKNAYYLEKINTPTNTVVYLTQTAMKAYFSHFLNKKLFRCPDEAYLFRNENNYILKVLEKKAQNVSGSVIDKLQIGNYMQYEYRACLGENFEFKYAFCLSAFLKSEYMSDTPRFEILREYNQREKVEVLFGDDENYFEMLDKWINSSS
jgi:hypothetical protein